jgi:hypothetical protein
LLRLCWSPALASDNINKSSANKRQQSNGNLSHRTTDLDKNARKALFCIKSYTTSLNNLTIKVANNLFDILVKPIMTYNSEVTYLDTFIKIA